MSITAIILTKNEEKNIERCLQALSFCDEILVIDDNSLDKTAEVAKQHNARIISHSSENDFSKQRNYAMQQAANDWILFVDADEIVTPELQKEVKQIITHAHAKQAYFIKRRDYFWGKEMRYGETQKVRNGGLIRLVKKDSGVWKGTVHETFHPKGETGRLNGFLNHYPHQTIKEFIEDINKYSTVRARELQSFHKKTNIFEIILYPLAKFILTYFLKLGFIDGPAGFTYAFMMSFHSFLVRTKLYQFTEIDSAK